MLKENYWGGFGVICVTEGNFDFDIPQGRVLSPILFSTLMDKIARYTFPQGTEVIVYADDTLLQCDAPRTFTLALSHLESLCTEVGLVINKTKTKFQATPRVCRHPSINSIKSAVCSATNTWELNSGFTKNSHCITYVRNQCLLRLAPLRALAHRGYMV